MTRTALTLSPHLDDAVFSCGGTLACLAAGGWRVVVATLFTASVPDPDGFALACQLDKGLGPEVDYMELRRAEDAEAVGIVGAEPVWLPFREAPHRGYGSAPELFGEVRPDDLIGPDLARAIGQLIRRFAPDLILAPQAVGGHVDHVQTVRAVRAAAPEAPITWWRDFPYGAKLSPKEPFGAELSGMTESAVALGPDALQARRAACRAYASQIGFQFGGPKGLDASLAQAGGCETFRGDAVLGALRISEREAAL